MWPPMSNSIRVLIVDDEPSVADALRLILEENGYEAVAVGTALEGMEQLRNGRFDITITDFRLPDLSGLDFLRQINGDDSLCPARILITAYRTPQLVAEAISLGVAEVLPKPFSPSALLSAIKDAISPRTHSQGSEVN
jgi:DNA-binding NtrC family response regulator